VLGGPEIVILLVIGILFVLPIVIVLSLLNRRR
jgi:hypothetical protein